MRGGRGERAKLSRVSLRSSYVLSHILTPTITHHYSPYLPYLPALPPLLHSSTRRSHALHSSTRRLPHSRSTSLFASGDDEGQVILWKDGVGSTLGGDTHTARVVGVAMSDESVYTIGWDDTLRTASVATSQYVECYVECYGACYTALRRYCVTVLLRWGVTACY